MSSLIDGIGARMRYLAERQRVVSENLANSETPGFKARDVAVPDFGSMVDLGGSATIARPRVAITPAMAALGARPGSSTGAILDPDTSETKPDGNNVTLEDQLLKMGAVQADFATMTSLYRKQHAMLRTALGRNGSA